MPGLRNDARASPPSARRLRGRLPPQCHALRGRPVRRDRLGLTALRHPPAHRMECRHRHDGLVDCAQHHVALRGTRDSFALQSAAMSVKKEKSFNTACQEEVYRQVKAYLDELVDEHFDDAEHCDFYLKYGSTVLEISIEPYQEDDAVIEVLAFCVQGIEPSFELMQELLRLNA